MGGPDPSGRTAGLFPRARSAGRERALHPPHWCARSRSSRTRDFYDWLEAELRALQLRLLRDARSVPARAWPTRAGQIKGGGERHEKDDRHRIDDRSRFVLGWSNEEKIAALEAGARDLEDARTPHRRPLRNCDQEAQRGCRNAIRGCSRLAVFESFRDLDWRPLATEIDGWSGSGATGGRFGYPAHAAAAARRHGDSAIAGDRRRADQATGRSRRGRGTARTGARTLAGA